MRVALYTETFLPQINGIVKVMCLTLEHLARAGIEAMVIAHDESVDEFAGAKVLKVPSVRNPLYPKGRLGIPNRETYRQLRTFRPDLMHMFHPTWAGVVGQTYARRLAVPTVASFHLDLTHAMNFYHIQLISRVIKRLLVWEFNRSSYALAPSVRVQEQMRSIGVRRVGLWRRGVDADRFHPRFRDEAMRNLLSDGHPNDALLLYVGRLAPEKQVWQLRALLERIPRTRLAIVGSGALQKDLEQHFKDMPAKFVGHMSGELLAKAYASSDVFVFPSAFESFGLVILEALASGTPVVSSKVGGAPQLISEGQSGYLFEVNDIKGMVEGVQKVISAPGRYVEMRLAARRHAENQSWTAIMDELIDCYRAIAVGQPPQI